jgi:hypothetical protein
VLISLILNFEPGTVNRCCSFKKFKPFNRYAQFKPPGCLNSECFDKFSMHGVFCMLIIFPLVLSLSKDSE